MSEYHLISDAHVGVTPAGAYYAASAREPTAARRMLFALLDHTVTPSLSPDKVCLWTGVRSANEAMDLLYRMQTVGWIRGLRAPQTAPNTHMERDVPALLKELAADGRALLADSQGFFLSVSGFTHETAEALGALAADIGVLATRHDGLVRENLGIDSAAWSVVDASGHSQLGFWPLYIGDQHFILVLGGEPCLHRTAFAQLVWGLARRYAGERDTSRNTATGSSTWSIRKNR